VSDGLRVGDDGRARCWWPGQDPDYLHYHDHEWGRPEVDDRRLFEKICLEGFQAGLSWLTILRKRERFRQVFADFDPRTVAQFGEHDVARLLGDPGIVRHEGKIRSAINNANRMKELVHEWGSLTSFVWSFAPDQIEGSRTADQPLPAQTPTSIRLAHDLKTRGWTFVGPTTMYAFMQAMGLVNDHLDGCWVRADCDAARAQVLQFGPTTQPR